MLDWITNAISDAFSDLANFVAQILCNLLLQAAGTFFDGFLYLMEGVGDMSSLTYSFNQLFDGTTLFDFFESVRELYIVPIGAGILALVMLVQLVKISQRMDATGTMPAIKDLVFLAVFYMVFSWLISNSGELAEAVYNVFLKVTQTISVGTAEYAEIFDLSSIEGTTNFGGCFLLVILGIGMFIFGFLAQIIVTAVCAARSLQLYVYMAMSPIPLALLGFDETRQSGINFIKSFCGLCLAGLIMMLVMHAYPYMLISAAGVSDTSIAGIINGDYGGVYVITATLAISVIWLFSLVKSGSWANAILGS